MTTLTSTTHSFSISKLGNYHLNPVLVPLGDVFLVFTSCITDYIYVMHFVEGVLRQKPISHKKFGNGFAIGLREDFIPNGILVKGQKPKTTVIYSFGRLHYPYLLRFNISTHETVDLNKDDKQLDINGLNGISNAAKICAFGDGSYILVTSKENELLIYDIEQNKFVKKVHNLSTCLTEENKKNMDRRLYSYLEKCYDSQYICKIKEAGRSVEFMLVNHLFITFVTIYIQKEKKFNISTKYVRNNMLGLDDNIKVVDFACCYVEEYEVLFISGGRSSKSNMSKDFVLLYDPTNDRCKMTKILLPCTLARHSMVYLPETKCIHVVGGATYKYKEEMELNSDSFYIHIDAFEKDIELLKTSKSQQPKPKLTNGKFSNEYPKNQN